MADGGNQQSTRSYAGDVTVVEAWDLLRDDSKSVLIDVRTDAEWAYVGLPDLSDLNKETKLVSWVTFPQMAKNPNFDAELELVAPDRDSVLLFLCRSGVRSIATSIAATEAGYPNSFNILGGFEGDKDDASHRGGGSGWKADGLPWRQS